LSVTLPTAVHARDELQETAVSALAFAPTGVGARWIDQRAPFQRSTSAAPSRGLALNFVPTATHIRREAHDTDTLRTPSLPGSRAARSRVHVEPFQRSTKIDAGANVPGPITRWLRPTATQLADDTQETLPIPLLVPAGRVGVR
jgi:hypothetical protein